MSIWDNAMDALDGKDPWAPAVSPYQQRQNDIQKQAEADRHAIVAGNVSRREADFEKSGLPPAQFREWVKDWNAKNGMDY